MAQQMESEQERHLRTPFLFDVSCLDRPHVLPPQLTGEKNRLRAYHPVIFKQAAQLKIAHFSDVHINSRHFSMAQSTAQVVEGVSPPVSKAVDNSCLAFKGLLDAAHKNKADAVFISGDLLDFNRNIDPTQTAGAPKDQYPLFDLLKSLQTSGKGGQPLYPRGIDDMLMFSLVLYGYQKLKLPVFMTTGNHEAYQVPYGISPRSNKSMYWAALPSGAGLPANISNASRHAAELYEKWLPGDVGQFFAKKLKDASEGISPYAASEGKANEGIPADHNMTIYEALLAFGPAYGVVMKGLNFSGAHYDWFFTLFTPLADYCVDYNRSQCLIGLDWGEKETFLNVAPGAVAMANNSWFGGDDQEIGILPRSDQGSAKRRSGLWNPPLPANPERSCCSAISRCSTSTASIRSAPRTPKTFRCVPSPTTAPAPSSATAPGSSSRSTSASSTTPPPATRTAAPSTARSFQGEKVKSLQAYNPGIDPERHADLFAGKETPIVVSSCAGPIGVQNMEGELSTWGLMPPSGTLLDLTNTSNPLTQITADARKYPFTRPRFCVVLDYIVTHRKGVLLSFVPAYWMDGGGPTETFYLYERDEIRGCTTSIFFHAFDYKTQTFVKADAVMTAQTNSPFKWKIQVPVNVLLKRQPSQGQNVQTLMAFAEIRFKASKISAQAKYRRYNFDDAWFVRIELDTGRGFTSLHFNDTGLPDFPWLGSNFSNKYSEKLSSNQKNQSMNK